MNTSNDYLLRVLLSNDGLTRTIQLQDGFYTIEEHNDDESLYTGYKYHTTYYAHGKQPHYMADKSLKEAYRTVKSGNPGHFRGNQWINK
jgi:hypothetical protein